MTHKVCYFKFDGDREIAEGKYLAIFKSLGLSMSCSILVMADLCGVQIQSKFIISIHGTPLVEPRFSWTFSAGPSTAELMSQKS